MNPELGIQINNLQTKSKNLIFHKLLALQLFSQTDKIILFENMSLLPNFQNISYVSTYTFPEFLLPCSIFMRFHKNFTINFSLYSVILAIIYHIHLLFNNFCRKLFLNFSAN